jgi:hypothetical protein
LSENPKLTGTDTLSVVALAEKTVDTSNGERETSLGRTTITERDASVELKYTAMVAVDG